MNVKQENLVKETQTLNERIRELEGFIFQLGYDPGCLKKIVNKKCECTDWTDPQDPTNLQVLNMKKCPKCNEIFGLPEIVFDDPIKDVWKCYTCNFHGKFEDFPDTQENLIITFLNE